jgi:hypothetical protein
MANDQHLTMDTTTPARPGTTRRAALRVGGLGAFATAFLVACGKDDTQAGVSGLPATTTSLAPTVPTTVPTEAALAEDKAQLQTAQSVELLVASVYARYGPDLRDAELRDAAARFEADHTGIARVFGEAGGETEESRQPNAYLEENLVKPAVDGLRDDASIADFLASLESALVATYINATGILTEAEWRQRVMSYGAASARRLAVLGGGGQGEAPTEPMFPLRDLIPGEAYLGGVDEEAGAG